MIEPGALKNLLSKKGLSNRDKILICLAVDPETPKQVKDIRASAIGAGLRAAKDWNISGMLCGVPHLAVNVTGGWVLTDEGRSVTHGKIGPFLPSVTPLVLSNLRGLLSAIASENTRAFVEEAIACFEHRLYRSSVVLSWVGAVSVLQTHVVQHALLAFNAEGHKRDQKWKSATNTDDLSRLKEFEFLQILAAISVIGKNVKDELEVCLKLRNACGHPNSLQVGELKASAHIETLLQNVFARF